MAPDDIERYLDGTFAVTAANKTWREIGECLGVSKQVLHKRYTKLVPQLRRRHRTSPDAHGLSASSGPRSNGKA